MNMVLKFLAVVIAMYVAAALVMYLLQRQLVFAPDTTRVQPAQVGLPNVAEVTLTTERGEALYCWHGKAAAGQPTLLFFHGNGASVSNRTGQFRQLMAAGYGVFMVGYPGYGGSDGSPSEAGFMEAANLAYAHLRRVGIELRDIVIYGESMGSSVAVQLAAAHDARALVLAAPMNSVLEVAQAQYPYMPVRWLLKDRFLSNDYIGDVHMPLLVVHGEQDSIIPISSGRKLFAAANEPKVFHVMDGAGHNDLYEFPIVQVITDFLAGMPGRTNAAH